MGTDEPGLVIGLHDVQVVHHRRGMRRAVDEVVTDIIDAPDAVALHFGHGIGGRTTGCKQQTAQCEKQGWSFHKYPAF